MAISSGATRATLKGLGYQRSDFIGRHVARAWSTKVIATLVQEKLDAALTGRTANLRDALLRLRRADCDTRE